MLDETRSTLFPLPPLSDSLSGKRVSPLAVRARCLGTLFFPQSMRTPMPVNSAGVGSTVGKVDIDADSQSKINSLVLSASLAIGIGTSGTGVGISLGVGIALNYIGWQPGESTQSTPAKVQAYLVNTPVHASGSLTLDASSNQSIQSIVVAGSIGIAGGKTGVAISGSGVVAINKVGVQVKSFIDGDGDGSNAWNSCF